MTRAVNNPDMSSSHRLRFGADTDVRGRRMEGKSQEIHSPTAEKKRKRNVDLGTHLDHRRSCLPHGRIRLPQTTLDHQLAPGLARAGVASEQPELGWCRAPPTPGRLSLAGDHSSQMRADEQIYLRHAPGEPHTEIDIVCECDRRTCSNGLRLSLERYDAIRQFPTRFVITPGHSHPDDERIAEEHGEFVVVEKTGPVTGIAIRLDPRKRQS